MTMVVVVGGGDHDESRIALDVTGWTHLAHDRNKDHTNEPVGSIKYGEFLN